MRSAAESREFFIGKRLSSCLGIIIAMPFWKAFFCCFLPFSPLTMIHAAWYFPHSYFSIKMMSENQLEWQGGGRSTKRWCALSFSLLFFSLLYVPKYPITQISSLHPSPARHARSTIILNKVIFVTFRWPQKKLKETGERSMRKKAGVN